MELMEDWKSILSFAGSLQAQDMPRILALRLDAYLPKMSLSFPYRGWKAVLQSRYDVPTHAMYCGALNVFPSAGISTETIVWSKLAIKRQTLNLFVFKHK